MRYDMVSLRKATNLRRALYTIQSEFPDCHNKDVMVGFLKSEIDKLDRCNNN
jgi:hypothetical protein